MPGIWQMVIIALVILILFGGGKIAGMMGEMGKGVSSFKKGLTEEDDSPPAAKAQIEAPSKDVSASETKTSKSKDT
ncbi:MAG: twin-arginine translocase TatA/TatE family subunit [Erythrobacter sp.]